MRPEDVTINLARGEKAPLAPAGHRWKGLVHNKKATWLAFWKDNINDHFKYVFLHASSVFKGQSDWEKYEKARELKKHIGKIRADYMRDLASADVAKAQRATAMYLIDQFALRVGCVFYSTPYYSDVFGRYCTANALSRTHVHSAIPAFVHVLCPYRSFTCFCP